MNKLIRKQKGSPFWYYRFQIGDQEFSGSTKIRMDGGLKAKKAAQEFAEHRKAEEMGAVDQRHMLDRAVDKALDTEKPLDADSLEKFAHDVFASLTETLGALEKVDGKLARAIRTKLSRELVLDHAKTMKVADAHGFWKQQVRRDIGGGRLKNRETTWEGFVEWLGENYPDVHYMHEVEPEVAIEYSNILWKCMKASTYRNKVGVLNSTFQDLRIQSGVSVSPFDYVKLGSGQDSTTKDVFTVEEAEALLKTAEGEMYAMCRLALRTGLRMGDCANMKWADVDLKEGAINLVPSKTAKHGTTVKIPIRPDLMEALLTLKRTGTYVFPNMAATYNRARSNVSYKFKKLMEQAEIKDLTIPAPVDKDGNKKGKAAARVGFHSFRKRFVSDLHESGSGQSLAKEFAGHKSDAVHEVYVKFSMEHKTNAINSIREYGKGA